MRIDTLIFDFGGVLYFPPQGKGLDRWVKLLKLHSDEQISQMINDPSNSDLFWDVMRGKIKERDLWDKLALQWHIPKYIFILFQRKLMSKKHLNKVLISFIEEKRLFYKTALLSNAGDQTRKLMEGSSKFHKLVDQIIISAEEGYAKPDNEIYRIALQKLNTKSENCVFIDDLNENIIAARDNGIHAIQFFDNQQTITALKVMLGEEI